MSSVPFNGLVKHVMRTYLQTQMHAVFRCFAFHDLCLTCFVQTIDFFLRFVASLLQRSIDGFSVQDGSCTSVDIGSGNALRG